MALATWAIELDLDDDGTFGYDIADYVQRSAGVSMQGRGRSADLDAAGISTLTLTLGNNDGRFSPGNTGGPYGTKLRPLKRIRVKVTYNAVVYDFFYGVIKAIDVRPMAGERTVFLSCEDMMSVLAATDIRLTLTEDALTGDIIDAILDEVDATIPRSLDAGDHRLGEVAYPRSQALADIQEVRDNELGGLFFFDGAGNAVFHDQSHRWHETHSTVSQATIDENFSALSYTMDAMDRISEVVLDFPRWETGEPGTPVFTFYPIPRTIPANGSITVEIDYGGGLVDDTIAPVANTDFTAEFADGSDATGSLNINLTDYGAAAKAVITSSSGNPIKLTAFQLRATPIRAASDLTPARATPTTPPAWSCVLSHSYRLQDSERAVQSWADYLAARFGDTQRARISLTVTEAFPDAPLTGNMATILARGIGDRITLNNDNYPFSSYITGGTFYIDGLGIAIGEKHIEATWQLVPTDAAMMIWDTSEWDSAAVWAP